MYNKIYIFSFLETNALIINKLNRIIFEKNNTQNKCSDKSGTDEKYSTGEIKQSKRSLIYDYFPLKDTNAVEEFEKLLKNKTFTVPQVVISFVKSNFIIRLRSMSYTSNVFRYKHYYNVVAKNWKFL